MFSLLGPHRKEVLGHKGVLTGRGEEATSLL